MKRKSNGVGVLEVEEEEEREEKRSRLEENGGKGVGEEAKIATKCPICLWPAGAPECYHTAANTPQTEL